MICITRNIGQQRVRIWNFCLQFANHVIYSPQIMYQSPFLLISF